MKEPTNEMETIVFFERMFFDQFEILSISSGFPDAVVLNRNNGAEYKAEFEFWASSFMEHEHNPFDCDVIICWINDLDEDIKFPVWELSTSTFPIFAAGQLETEIFQLKIENKMLTRKIRSVEKHGNLDNADLPRDWRRLRPLLSDSRVEWFSKIPTSDIPDIATRYGVTEKTVSNWRTYARAELGVTDDLQ